MTIQERIYEAKERWNLSFVQLAFLLDLDRETIKEFYVQEKKKRTKAIAIKPNSDIDCMGLSTRTRNLLKRKRVNTIKQLVKFKNYDDVMCWSGVGYPTAAEILGAASRARKELDAEQQS